MQINIYILPQNTKLRQKSSQNICKSSHLYLLVSGIQMSVNEKEKSKKHSSTVYEQRILLHFVKGILFHHCLCHANLFSHECNKWEQIQESIKQ